MSLTNVDPLLERLRQGDEIAFGELVARYHTPLKRLALSVLRDEAAADEVVQDAWTAAIEGLDSFEGRSALGTWLYRIVLNRARTRRVRDARTTPLSALEGEGEDEPAIDPTRFLPDGHWKSSPTVSAATPFGQFASETPEQALLRGELGRALSAALDKLPEQWRLVVRLRDVDGLSSEEVCNALEISESNQRVLLHRGRSRLRMLVEDELERGGKQP